MGKCTAKRYSTTKLKRFQARVAFNGPGKPGQICWKVAGEQGKEMTVGRGGGRDSGKEAMGGSGEGTQC